MAAPQSNKGSRSKPSSGASGSGQMNAIALLEQDHREVQGLFKRFQSAGDEDTRVRLAAQICRALKVHAQIEEELFYPEARDEIGEPQLVEEAVVEHQAAKELISEIERMKPGEELFLTRMKVLREQIDHHIREEESKLFPACEKAGMELDRLGRKLAERKQQLAGASSRAH